MSKLASYDPEDPTYEALCDPAQRQQRPDDVWLLQRAVTTATGSIVPLFVTGDKIVVERWSNLLNDHPWLDTRTYLVKRIDKESGNVECIDVEARHYAVVNYKNEHQKFFLAPDKKGT